MSAAVMDDTTLVARFHAAAGVEREAAFDAIFEGHRARVLALCLRLTRDRGLAEDALQETFLDVYRGLPTFRGDARLSTWIYRIALRTALRLRARRPEVAADREPAAAHDPRAALDARDRCRRVEDALAALPAEQRTVVCLFAVDGLGHAEIAEILGVPEGTVKSRLFRGRRILQRKLANYAVEMGYIKLPTPAAG